MGIMLRGRTHTGLVTTWVEGRGFGFISPTEHNIGDLFVHVDSLRDRSIRSLKRGDRVRFEVEMNTNPTKNSGKKFAVNVELTGGRDKDRSRSRGRSRSRSKRRSRSRSSRKSRSSSR